MCVVCFNKHFLSCVEVSCHNTRIRRCMMAYLSKHKHEGCDSRLSTKKIRLGRRGRLKIHLSWEKSTLVFSSADIERSSV